MMKKQFNLSDYCLYVQDIIDIKIEYLIDGFLPEKTLFMLTGKYGSGKSLFCYALAKKLIQNGHEAVYVDADMALNSVSDRLNQSGLVEFLGEKIFYFHRTKKEIKISNFDWNMFKDFLKDQSSKIIFLDNFKDISPYKCDLNKDDHVLPLMNELKEIRDFGHTIILLHHISKENNHFNPFKNSGSIVDACDIAYSLSLKDRIFELTCFKDRIQVDKKVTFLMNDSFDLIMKMDKEIELILEKLLKIQEETKQTPNQSQLIKSLEGEIAGNKIRQLLKDGNYKHWITRKGPKNSSLISVC